MSALTASTATILTASSALQSATKTRAARQLQESVFLGSRLQNASFGSKAVVAASFFSVPKATSMGKPSWFPSFGGGPKASLATSDTANIALDPDTDTPEAGLQFATFGAGCFWGVELAFQRLPGVVRTEVGYTQGNVHNPSYEDVCSGRTGHNECVRVQYDPKQVGYEALLDLLWSRIDPTTLNRQGNDRGTQYRSGIYYYSEEQEKIARASVEKQQKKYNRPIVTELIPAKKWYRAENYHQQYLSKGGRMGFKQSAEKGCTDTIRCYG